MDSTTTYFQNTDENLNCRKRKILGKIKANRSSLNRPRKAILLTWISRAGSWDIKSCNYSRTNTPIWVVTIRYATTNRPTKPSNHPNHNRIITCTPNVKLDIHHRCFAAPTPSSIRLNKKKKKPRKRNGNKPCSNSSINQSHQRSSPRRKKSLLMTATGRTSPRMS